MAESLRPHLARDGIFNVRDLGGLPLEDGGVVRRRRVLRGDALQRATTSVDRLRDFGIVRVIDLRHDDERERDGVFSGDGVEVLHMPLSDPAFRWVDQEREEGVPMLATRYRLILETFGDRLAAGIRSVAEVVDKNDTSVVAYHCAIGKDRTGLLTMLLQGAIGVRRDAIVEDYVRSGRATAVQATWLRYMGYYDVPEEELESGLWSALPETMELTIDWLDRTHGGAGSYLRSIGVEPEAIESLRANLSETPNTL